MIVKKDKDIIQNYFEDNSGVRGSNADFVAIAEKEEDIPVFLKEMSAKKIPITVAGALTANTASGLAFGGVVLSLEKLNKIGEIKKIDESHALITVQAGARVSDIKAKTYSEGWLYPPDPTEKNAFIGGNIATNASGGRGFKFGVTRDYVKALKVAFADGSIAVIERGKYFADKNGNMIFDTNKGKKKITLPKYVLPNIKNAAGYYNQPQADLTDILIGSEGTLCVFIESVLKLIPHFKEVFGGIIFFDDRNKAYEFVKRIKSISKRAKSENLKNSINAMSLEYFDKNALFLIKDDYPIIPENAEAGIMFEQDVYEDNSDILMEQWIKEIEDNGINLEKVWFASNLSDMEKFRVFRHKIPEKVNEIVKKNKIPKVGTDFAVPDGKLSTIIDFCEQEFKNTGVLNLTFGHIGENHLHANIIATNECEYEECRKMYIRIAQKVVELGGTVSAEHGIGKLRHAFLAKMLGEEGFKELAQFKKSLDTNGILGVDNIFPKQYLI
ncbi:FAD-binding oxidoreductase [Candidatus Endomicrobiellum devescovinae]|jgi:D-lactate dehydrogenase (cytochrome)|uniref:FAD-binding oxidoreductase n=1 Tax=Candidatus Endomicrobiellum devescovinae TaxID=3242322 RepID=UPI00281B26BC|nr:FAD-binding oxidoreductase [Endomicrobium sp.]